MNDQLDQLPTEQRNPRTAEIDQLDSLGIVTLLNAEDQRVPRAVSVVLPDIARAVDLALERWQQGGRLVLFGAGTSGRLAALDAAELGPTFGVPTNRYLARIAGGAGAFEQAVEGAEDDVEAGTAAAADLAQRDLAFGLSASGRTPWVLAALEQARDRGAATVGLACVPRPRLAECADVCIVVETGPEPIAGSTRMNAGTAQKLVLNAFSSALMVRLGKVYGNLMVDMRATNAKLRRRALRLVQTATDADTVSAERALLDAGGEVKIAIASLRLGVDVAEAGRRLEAAHGRLRVVLGEG